MLIGSSRSSILSPPKLILYDANFVNSTFTGGSQPINTNTIDGRLFRQQIATTQPNFVEQSDGSLKTYATTQTVRWSDRGLALAGDRQNRVIQNRDLTNVAWTKTNCTALKNQTGRTQVANSASQLTATANAATCLQSITVTSLLLRGYVDVKRITGSGTIEMTMDNGTTWTVLDLSSPIINGWCRASIPTQTLANPTVGFRLQTSGDVFGIDLVELSDGGEVEYEPVPTTTASVKGWRDRASALISDGSPLAYFARDQGTQVYYFEYAQRRSGALIASDGDLQITSNDTTGAGMGTVFTSNLPTISPNARLTGINKAIFWRSRTASAACLNGGPVSTGSGFTPDGLLTHWDLGTNGAGNLSMQGLVRRFWCGKVIPSNALMQKLTS